MQLHDVPEMPHLWSIWYIDGISIRVMVEYLDYGPNEIYSGVVHRLYRTSASF